MEFQIEPHKGAGLLRFGMTPDQVRSAIGLPFKSFKKAAQSPYPCDAFANSEVFAFYTAKGKANAFEFFEPSSPIFKGHDLLKLSYRELTRLISEQDPTLVIENDGFTSKPLGIGCYAPAAVEEPHEYAETIIVFGPGYYETALLP